MPTRSLAVALMLGCVIACSKQTDATADRPEAEGGVPRFAAGVYQLVLVRDEPLFNDSLAAREQVEARLPWSSISAATNWRDSARVVYEHLRSVGWDAGPREGPADTTASDSALSMRVLLIDWSCVKWRSAATLRLDTAGRFVIDEEVRSYCRGSMPAYSRRTVTHAPATLETCTAWEPPVTSQVPHLTCREGRWWEGMYPYRSVGDTLELGTDCDGRETYVLRGPQGLGQAVAWSSDVAKLDDC